MNIMLNSLMFSKKCHFLMTQGTLLRHGVFAQRMAPDRKDNVHEYLEKEAKKLGTKEGLLLFLRRKELTKGLSGEIHLIFWDIHYDSCTKSSSLSSAFHICRHICTHSCKFAYTFARLHISTPCCLHRLSLPYQSRASLPTRATTF
ncbi:hypothetical protein KP509_34G052000 [Ceratopteris richardii]|uniref:Uncharacterized protein n=1 Tax=Ceratopteris richardii TaxID=49495 RepID=A0A8T2QKE1_CERRI|nr:hypothetical protein KP509_34G052000 [Ceratopteris richardii]